MNLGDTISIKAHKADGVCYRWRDATVIELDESHIAFHMSKGTSYHDLYKGVRIAKYDCGAVYQFDKPWTRVEILDDAGMLIRLYMDICSPPRIVNGEVHYTDYELDVERVMPHPARLVDEDEFAEAVITYGYTPKFQAQCYAAAQEVLDVANAYQALTFPRMPESN